MECYNNTTRLTLLLKLRKTDNNTAWTEFVTIYSPFIYNLIRRMSFQHHDSKDLTQIVMTKVWQKFDKYKAEKQLGDFRGWITTVTRNVVRDFIRTKKNFITNSQSVEFDESDNLCREIEEYILPNCEEIARKEWIVFVTNMAKKNVLETASENKRKIFEMSMKDIPVKEIARKLSITETRVYVSKQELFTKMKKEVEKLNNEL